MLFYLYLASIAVSTIVIHMVNISFTEKLKHDRIQVMEKCAWEQEFLTLVLTFVKIVLPIFNLIYLIYLLCFYQSIYQKFVTKLFLQGKVIFNEDFREMDGFLDLKIH